MPKKRSSHLVRRVADLPDVLFLEDLAWLLRCSPWTIRRRVRGGVFPLSPLPSVDNRLRFSRAAAERLLERGGGLKL